MISGIRIRTFNKSDIPSLLCIMGLNTPRYFDFSEREDFNQYLNTETEDYFVLEFKNQIVGSGGINYVKKKKLAVLSWDMIHPEFHGQGLGKKLFLHRLEIIRAHKSIQFLKVRSSQHAYKFYEKMGFQLVVTEKNYWAPGFDLYELHWPYPI